MEPKIQIKKLRVEKCHELHQCPSCRQEIWSSLQEFERHVLDCIEAFVICPVCGEQGPSTSALQTHINHCLDSIEKENVIPKHKKKLDFTTPKVSRTDKHKSNSIPAPAMSSFSLQQKPKVPKKLPKERSRRDCPWYKLISGTSFSMDAFSYGQIPNCSAYFLSHFHADHYIGLNGLFQGQIYCSSITASLITQELRVSKDRVHILPYETECDVEGVKVTLIDANQ